MSARRLSVVLSPEAQIDFEGILVYGRREWGEDRANDYAATIYSAIQDLARFPYIGPARPHLFPGARCRVVEQHLVFYRVDGTTVTVVRILHGRMDIAKQFT